MAAQTTGVSFVLRGDETIEGFLGENADTFRTVCQIAQKKKIPLTTENIKSFSDEFSETYKRQLIDAASSEGDRQVLTDFIEDFMLQPDDDASNSRSNESSDSLEKQPFDSDLNDRANGNSDGEKSECMGITSTDEGADMPLLDNYDIKWLNIPETAVKENRLDIIKICINARWDLELFRNLQNRTLLAVALSGERPKCDLIKLLLKHVGVNISSDRGATPLHDCMSNQCLSGKEKLQFLQLLLANGADCKLTDELLGSPLHSYICSLQFSHTKEKLEFARDIIQVLVLNGSDLNGVDWFGQSILSTIISTIPNVEGPFSNESSVEVGLEIRKMKVDLLEFLLKIGSKPNQRDKLGRTALHMAMVSRNSDVIKILIGYGADVNAITNTGSTPVYYFCHQGDWGDDEESINEAFTPVIEVLRDAEADMNFKAIDKSTVLHFASARLNETSCSALMDCGARLDARDYLLRTPLHMAARNKLHPIVCETLIKGGSEINARDINKSTPLHTACLFDNAESVRILLESKADVSAHDELGIQPIHIAAENGDETMVQHLLDFGADIHAEDRWKATPLHYSASDGNIETTIALIDKRADKHRLDQQGRKPLDLSRYRGHFGIAELLKDQSSDVKFGNFAPNLFPNRKSVKPDQVDEYFENIIQDISSMGLTTAEIAESILSSSGVGRISFNAGESKDIFDIINRLVADIIDRVGELDPIFKCKLLSAGSTAEGVKIGYPDEFDFVCDLEKFSAMVQDVEKDVVPFYAKIRLKTPVPEQFSRFCIGSSGHLNAANILRYFHCLIRQAMFDVLGKGYRNIYAGLLLLHHHESIFDESAIGLAKLQGLSFSWRGGDHKLLDISIDLNPVVFWQGWPDLASRDTPLLKNISNKGIYLIPKQCKTNIMAFPLEIPSSHAISDLWRYSTHHIEALVMRSLPQNARDCYMLCKAFRMEPLSCAVQLEPVLAWYSEAQLQKLSQVSAGLETANLGSNESFVAPEFNLEGIQNSIGTADIDLTNPQDDKFGENVFYQDENELTAESSIPSYYLKTIFLAEAEAIIMELGEFPDDINIWNILRRVYEKLHQAVESEHLNSPFFPEQEIYSNPDHANARDAKKVRQLFSTNILNLIRNVEQIAKAKL